MKRAPKIASIFDIWAPRNLGTLGSLPRCPTQIVPIFDNFSDVNKICFHQKIANCPSLLSVACCDEVYLLSYKLEGGLSCRAESVSKSVEVNEFVQNSNSQLLKLKLKYSFSEITTLRSVMAKWLILYRFININVDETLKSWLTLRLLADFPWDKLTEGAAWVKIKFLSMLLYPIKIFHLPSFPKFR